MIQQKKINVERILRVNRVGAWRIEIEDGKSPRFYADAVMDELLGIQGEISPEERFTFHRARVHPDDMQLFLEYSDKLSETKSEIVYRYIHPTFGEMFVRCSGIRVILSILVYTLFSRMFDLMQPPAVKHSIAVV